MSLTATLSQELDTLPVAIGKTHLWLVYRNAKPLATIVLTFDWEKDDAKKALVTHWLEQAGLQVFLSQRFADTLHVSKDRHRLETNQKYELSDESEAHQIRGLLYGFPKEAVQAYSTEIVKDKPFPSDTIIHPCLVDDLRQKYWYPYTEYLLRRNFAIDDSLVAKQWADILRSEIPKIAAVFEKETTAGMENLRVELLRLE